MYRRSGFIASPTLISGATTFRKKCGHLQAILYFGKHMWLLMCVCVSHPGSKGFPRSCLSTTNTACFTPSTDARVPTARTVFQQGGKASSDEPCPTKLRRWRGSEWRRPFVYLQPKLLTMLSNLLCLIPWFFMLPPPNLLVPSSCAAGLIAAAL